MSGEKAPPGREKMKEEELELELEEEEEKVQKVTFYKLFGFADRLDVVMIVIGTICAIGNGLSQPMMTIVLGQLIDNFGSANSSNVLDQVSQVSLNFVYLAIATAILAFLQVASWTVSGERQAVRIRGLYLKTILRQDIAFFDTETKTGEVIGRMSGDTVLIQEAMGDKVGKFIQLWSTLLGGFAVALIKGWHLTVVLIVCLPIIVIAGAVIGRIISTIATHVQKANADAGDVVEQAVGAIRTVASFTREKQAIEKYNSKLQIAYDATVKQGLTSGLGLAIIMFVVLGAHALAIWAMGQCAPCLSTFASGQAAAYKMLETIKRQPKIDVYDTSGMILENMNGEIELKDVCFRYPSRPDVLVFSGFSLHVTSGTTAALVGQSGSGKSTVINLLERFYDPDAGEVLIDGVDIKKLQLKWLREQIGLVSQEPVLFATTIKENILYGKENATDEDIKTAIGLANAAKFIDKLPQGLDTMVGEHGTQLSGGQKQRIAIARAILKNPKILLLDEATSALDAESERIVQDALVKVTSNRTTIIVAHRLTTIRNADIIAVVQQGKLVEKGTNEELIGNPEGAYSRLIRLQEEAKKEAEHSNVDLKSSFDMDKTISRSSRSLSMRRSVGSVSSGSRRSFAISTLGFGVPRSIDVHETEVEEESVGRGRNEIGTGKRKRVPFSRLASLNKPEIPVLLLGSVGAVIHGLFFPIFALILSSAVNTFFKPPAQLRKDSRFWSLLYVGLGVINLLALPVQNYFFGVAGGKLIERLRSLTFQKVVHQEISWFDDPANSSGAVGARLSTDAAQVRNVVGDALALYIQNIATITAGLVIAFTANWIIALVILGVTPLIIGQEYLQTKVMKGFSKGAKVMYEEASQVADDAVGSIRTVASFCAEKKVMDLYEKKCEGPLKSGVRIGLLSGAGFGFSFFILYCTNAFCFYIGALLTKHGKATFGEVFKVFFALALTGIGISQATAMAPDKNKAKDAVTSIFQILDSKPNIDSSSDEGLTRSHVNGDITFEHVSFKYPTRPDIQILKDLCLNIPSGKTVALVGESGSGKSTVISLIERFYDPDSGQVFLDNLDIKTLNLKWLRQQMGLVSQEPILFNDTIRANIAYGKLGDATEEEIIAAAKAANAHNFISAMQNGYDTSPGERGVQMSGGQKQRIAIARAIVKNPKILLLDEATSALDAASEHVVQEALERLMVNRTTVVVAHRLTTIKAADIIAVVKNGVIAEKGRHDELMKIIDGAYASLVNLQMTSS
ncbi:ABC transporter B family member 9-like isoform X2 [Tripterygium wilfordii]|uniref:ABC transporter B family member 9-like isoform X2 n=1 Tax=Tripterygium wilfordii TaxID=458696 RepID=UPI0018F7E6E7|nr:ABC transporter B family member 9-like isoform X2 [Tripterygium wilfordii]